MNDRADAPVQVATYGPAVAGHDLVVQARTGTGKTAAFGIPLVDRLTRTEGGAQVLILAPTRELALQSSREIARLGAHRGHGAQRNRALGELALQCVGRESARFARARAGAR